MHNVWCPVVGNVHSLLTYGLGCSIPAHGDG